MAVSDPQKDYYSRLLTSYRGRTLKRGARGKTVRALQLFLKDQGYDIAADGDFGRETERAVRDWQRKEGLSQDGQVGQRQSFTRIRETVTPRPRQRPSKAPSFNPEAGATRGPTSVPGLGTPSRLTQKDETLDEINRRMMPVRKGPQPSFAAEATLKGPTSTAGGPVGPALATQEPPPEMPHHSPITMPDGTVLGKDPRYPVMSAPVPPPRAPDYEATTDASIPPEAEEPVPEATGGPSPLESALAGGGVPQPPMDVGNFVPPPSPRPQPGPGAMANQAMTPIKQGRFPGLPPVPPEMPQGEMTPEDIALIKALLQSRALEQAPPATGPAF